MSSGPTPNGSTRPREDDGDPDAFVKHAELCWKAAEVNSTRLAAKANLVLSGVTAVLGLKLFSFGKEVESVRQIGFYSVWFWLFWIPFVLGFLLLVWALGSILEFGKGFGELRSWRSRFIGREPLPNSGNDSESVEGTSSGKLVIRTDAAQRPWAVSKPAAQWYFFKLVYDAATDLEDRNFRRKTAIDRAQRGLFFCIILVIWSTVAAFVAGQLKIVE